MWRACKLLSHVLPGSLIGSGYFIPIEKPAHSASTIERGDLLRLDLLSNASHEQVDLPSLSTSAMFRLECASADAAPYFGVWGFQESAHSFVCWDPATASCSFHHSRRLSVRVRAGLLTVRHESCMRSRLSTRPQRCTDLCLYKSIIIQLQRETCHQGRAHVDAGSLLLPASW